MVSDTEFINSLETARPLPPIEIGGEYDVYGGTSHER